MAAKKSKKSSKTLGKKTMKKTKGGAVDMFIKLKPADAFIKIENSLAPNLNTNLGGLNFHK